MIRLKVLQDNCIENTARGNTEILKTMSPSKTPQSQNLLDVHKSVGKKKQNEMQSNPDETNTVEMRTEAKTNEYRHFSTKTSCNKINKTMNFMGVIDNDNITVPFTSLKKTNTTSGRQTRNNPGDWLETRRQSENHSNEQKKIDKIPSLPFPQIRCQILNTQDANETGLSLIHI